MVNKDILVIGSNVDEKFKTLYQKQDGKVFGKDNKMIVESLEKGPNHRVFRGLHVDYVILKCPVKEHDIQRYIQPMVKEGGKVIEDHLEKYSEMNPSAKKLSKQQLSSLAISTFSSKP